MTSITYIDLNLSEVNCAVVVYAKQNDRLSRHIAATLYDGASSWTPPAGSYPIIRFLKPDGTSGFYDVDEDGNAATTISGNVATMTIVEQALTVPGDVYMELNFYNTAGEKLTTLKWLLRVQQSVLEDSTIISSDYYNVLSAQIAAALAVTAHPPYIDSTTKNWMIWDVNANAYVDSGYSAEGQVGPYFTPAVDSSGNISWTNNGGLPNPTTQNIKGPQGIQGPTGAAATIQVGTTSTGAAGTNANVTNSGTSSAAVFDFTIPKGDKGDQGSTGPQGVSITSTSKASGTGAPGTTDVYNVNLSNGTVGGTFSVYNGNDGQGSPGSQDPIMDGTASPGSATAYSREDHVHPSDTAKVNKSGDTMTGNLVISKNDNPVISLKNTDMDNTAATQASDEMSSVNFNDRNNNVVGFINVSESTTGTDYINHGARKSVGGNNIDNVLTLGVDKDGNKIVAVSDAGVWRTALNAVNKAGDTMTGDLVLSNAEAQVKSTGLTDGAGVGSTTQGKRLAVVDSNDYVLGYVSPRFYSDGAQGIDFGTQRTISDSEEAARITLGINSDTSRFVSMSTGVPQAFRKALGLGTNGALPIPIGQGGTGATTVDDALSNLDLGGLRLFNSYAPANGSKKINLSNGARGIIVTTRAANSGFSLSIFQVGSGGMIYMDTPITDSVITFTKAANVLTLAHSYTYAVNIYVLILSGNTITFT